MRLGILLVALVFALPVGAKNNGKASPAAQMQSGRIGGGGASTGYAMRGHERAPLDPKRHIVEQDCSKPLDLTVGNLKCK
ncbi:MAG: hypothetical protein JO035_06760 [Betaproteobacteria bacterium]|nr:hypothetical protein [Betaproteobacteria bacterium]